MTDYSTLKVPDLKKLLGDRSLPISGNKADLITRLQEDDKKSSAAPGAAEDEIDWDEDDNAITAPATAAVAVGSQSVVSDPVVVPNQKVDVNPSTTSDLKAAAKDAPTAANSSSAAATKPDVAVEPEAPKQNFAIGIQQTDAEKEAEKRAARAKRFGITEDDEEKKKLDRAKKFGTDKELVVKGLDDALPERKAKRGREGGEKQGGRGAKRQTPDRRTEAPPAKAAAPAKKPIGRITDDPVEKAKAEARAKRFN